MPRGFLLGEQTETWIVSAFRNMVIGQGALALNFQKPKESVVDESLLEKCRRQDYEAFGKLVDAYQNRVFGFVRRMVPTGEDAEDITQEVFIRAFQNFHRFDMRSSVRTWLFKIAHNLCVDRARKVGRSPEQVSLALSADIEEEFEVPDDRWQPDQMLAQSNLEEAVELAVSQLSEKLRSVLILHDREDMPYEEIATTLNLPLGTVKSRLFLARTHVQNALKQYMEDRNGNLA